MLLQIQQRTKVLLRLQTYRQDKFEVQSLSSLNKVPRRASSYIKYLTSIPEIHLRRKKWSVFSFLISSVQLILIDLSKF